MSDPKMQVIFIKQTGHVLAVFSRTADDSKPKVEDVVGTGFPFRNMLVADAVAVNGGELVLLPPESLDIATVDFDEDAFLMPLNFVASGTKVDQLGNVTLPAPVLTASNINIKVMPAVSEKTKVWAAIQQVNPIAGEQPVRRVVEGEIAIGGTNVVLDLKSLPDRPPASIGTGDYDVLVLVAGQQRRSQRLSVP